MRCLRISPIWICALLGSTLPLLLCGQSRMSEFVATEVLPAHAPKVLHAAVTEAFPGSVVSVEGDRVKVRAPNGVDEASLLFVLQSAGLGSFQPTGRPAKQVERKEAGSPASGANGPPGEEVPNMATE